MTIDNDLPKLTDKQQQFVLCYIVNGNNGADAYRFAYDCSGSKEATINKEVNKLLKNPNITPWLKQAEKNTKQVFNEEIKYSVKDCFDELDDVQFRAREASNCYTQELKAIELKGKLAGHFTDKHQITGNIVQMPSVTVDNKELVLNTGENPSADTA